MKKIKLSVAALLIAGMSYGQTNDSITIDKFQVYEIMKEKLQTLPCWEKYKSYTATNNIPLVCRGVELV